jgi:hypothetical protein
MQMMKTQQAPHSWDMSALRDRGDTCRAGVDRQAACDDAFLPPPVQQPPKRGRKAARRLARQRGQNANIMIQRYALERGEQCLTNSNQAGGR